LQTKDMHGNAKEGLDDFFLVQKSFIFLQKVCSKWTFLTNWNLLIIDGHGNHVTPKAIEQA